MSGEGEQEKEEEKGATAAALLEEVEEEDEEATDIEVAKATEAVWREAERWVQHEMLAEEEAWRRMERRMARQRERQQGAAAGGQDGEEGLLDEVGLAWAWGMRVCTRTPLDRFITNQPTKHPNDQPRHTRTPSTTRPPRGAGAAAAAAAAGAGAGATPLPPCSSPKTIPATTMKGTS